jgi:hypothetical protein
VFPFSAGELDDPQPDRDVDEDCVQPAARERPHITCAQRRLRNLRCVTCTERFKIFIQLVPYKYMCMLESI